MAQKKKSTAKAKATKATAPAKKASQAKASARSSAAGPAASKSATAPAKKSSSAAKPSAAKSAVAKTARAKPAVTKSAPALAGAQKVPAAKAPAAKAPAAKAPAAKASVAVVRANSQKSAAAAAAAFAAHRAQAAPARAIPAAAGKSASGAKITAPAKSAEALASPKAIAEKAAAARELKKPVNQRHGFKTNEFIVYPAHGVGRIIGIEEQEIAGMALELFVINFEKEKLTLRVPTGKLASVGMRKLADDDIVKKAMDILKGRARVKRTMWSRRAQEYVAKINSGDLISIAEVVRDLYRSEAQPEQSYSERQLYEDALDRMAREIAAVEKLDDRGAVQRITEVLSKSARGRRLAEEGEGEEVQAA
jgi:CarD family transcriptional regulator